MDRETKTFVTNDVFGLFLTQKRSSKLSDKSYGTPCIKKPLLCFATCDKNCDQMLQLTLGFSESLSLEIKYPNFAFVQFHFMITSESYYVKGLAFCTTFLLIDCFVGVRLGFLPPSLNSCMISF